MYIINILLPIRAAEIPIDPYWGAVILHSFRFILALLALTFAKKLPRRITYITCMGIQSIATSMIGTYFFLKENNIPYIKDNIYIRMIPVLSIGNFKLGHGPFKGCLNGAL